jgi:hypothetical protein
MTRGFAAAALVMTIAACGSAHAETCAPKTAPDPADTLKRMYAAAMKPDREAVLREFAPDFYAFDGGRRLSGTELADLATAAHAAGKTYAWSVEAPEVHLACDTAWVAYVNRGSVTDATGTHPLTWLESAVLVWRDGAWKLSFFHSTRAAPAS